MFLKNEIHKYEEQLYDFIFVKSKVIMEFVKNRFKDVNLAENKKENE